MTRGFLVFVTRGGFKACLGLCEIQAYRSVSSHGIRGEALGKVLATLPSWMEGLNRLATIAERKITVRAVMSALALGSAPQSRWLPGGPGRARFPQSGPTGPGVLTPSPGTQVLAKQAGPRGGLRVQALLYPGYSLGTDWQAAVKISCGLGLFSSCITAFVQLILLLLVSVEAEHGGNSTGSPSHP